MMNSPKDTTIDNVWTSIDKSSMVLNTIKKVRIYKDTPSTVNLQIWGLRANTQMYANAHLTREQLTQLINEARELLNWLPEK